MNTILTDDEIKAECRVGFGIDPVLDGNLIKFGRAIEAAVLAKLARQEPALLVRCELPQHKGQWMAEDGRRFLLSDPAPQHADRQRVPANKANNEFNRVIQHAITLGSEAASFLRCWNEGNWDGCREFDFEPALPYEIEEQADRQRVPEGHTLVPVEILDRFPEMNPSNYDHDDVCELNAWGVELVLAAAPEAPEQRCPNCDDTGHVHDQTGEWRGRCKCPAGQQAPATAVGQVPQAVAYLDIGAGGYLDIGSELSNEQLQQLPKGRHMLAIVGTFGVDGYTPAATEAPAQASAVDERAAFEAWRRSFSWKRPFDPGEWEAWQARAALAQKGGK